MCVYVCSFSNIFAHSPSTTHHFAFGFVSSLPRPSHHKHTVARRGNREIKFVDAYVPKRSDRVINLYCGGVFFFRAMVSLSSQNDPISPRFSLSYAIFLIHIIHMDYLVMIWWCLTDFFPWFSSLFELFAWIAFDCVIHWKVFKVCCTKCKIL